MLCAAEPGGRQSGVDWKGFDVPLELVTGEKFSQPILGSNNLAGNVPLLDGVEGGQGALQSVTARWALYFRNGGFGTFIGVFHRVIRQVRAQMSAPTAPPVAEAAEGNDWAQQQPSRPTYAAADVWAGSDEDFVAVAVAEVCPSFVDPTDSTTVLAIPVAEARPAS